MNLTYRNKTELRNSKTVGEAASPEGWSHPNWRNQSRIFETEVSK